MRPSHLVIMLSALVFFFGCLPPVDLPVPSPSPTPAPAPTPPHPPGRVVDFAPVTAALAGCGSKAACREYSAGWRSLAFALRRADLVGKPVKTTDDLRALIIEWEPLQWKATAVEGFCPGVSAVVNDCLATALGRESRALNPGEAASIIEALARACQ